MIGFNEFFFQLIYCRVDAWSHTRVSWPASPAVCMGLYIYMARLRFRLFQKKKKTVINELRFLAPLSSISSLYPFAAEGKKGTGKREREKIKS